MKNLKRRKVSNEEFTQYYNDEVLWKKIRYVIKQKSSAFTPDEIEDIITDGMMRGLSYYREGYKKTVHTNIVQYIVYTILNRYRDFKNKRRKDDIIKEYYIANKSGEYNLNHIDLLLDIDCLPETEKTIVKHLLDGYSHSKVKIMMGIGDKKFKSALSSIARCILNRPKKQGDITCQIQ